MTVSLVAGVSRNGVIGHDGALPWRLPADLKHFAQLTKGSTVVMGRKTFDSIIKHLGHPLTGRQNIVITRNPGFRYEGAVAVGSLEDALNATESDEVFVIGGAQIYELALPRADKLYLTDVEVDLEGDTRFPKFDRDNWRVVAAQPHPADEANEYAFTLRTLERKHD